MHRHCGPCLREDSMTFSTKNNDFYTCSKCKQEMCFRHIKGICHKCKEIYCEFCCVYRPWFANVNICESCWHTLVEFKEDHYQPKYKCLSKCEGKCTSWPFNLEKCLQYQMILDPL